MTSARRQVSSFDVFDTLLARRVRRPIDIFDLVETKVGVPGFAALRRAAESRARGTLESIYECLKQEMGLHACTDLQKQALMQAELQVEAENIVLIQETADLVQDGDILVSDMYMTEDQIWALLRAAGFDKAVTLYVSPGGKASGSMFDRLLLEYDIRMHHGDNPHSDVHMPYTRGIPTRFVTISHETDAEKSIRDAGLPTLAQLLRVQRLRNPYAPGSEAHSLYNVQLITNLPFLVDVSRHIARTAAAVGATRLLFFTRDGCLLRLVANWLYPELRCEDLACSRNAFVRSDPAFVDYIASMNVFDSALCIDLHGRGASAKAFFKKAYGRIPPLYVAAKYGSEADVTSYTTDAHCTALLEIANGDVKGSLLTVDAHGPVYYPMEYDFDLVQAMHAAVQGVVVDRGRGEAVRAELETVSAAESQSPWQAYLTRPWDPKPFAPLKERHVATHTGLTALANKHATDKGSEYMCAHGYTRVYEVLIGQLLRDRGFDKKVRVLEIGLNRVSGMHTTPSALMFLEYFHNQRVEYTGFDIDPGFRACARAPLLRIIIGDQSNPASLAQCGDRAYDLIIDDGCHANSHQQISLRTLWEFVAPGGFYIIEDLHWQPFKESVLSTRAVLKTWQETPHLPAATLTKIRAECASVAFYDSLSTIWGDTVIDALVVLQKKKTH